MKREEICKDYPEANGRIAKPGEHGFLLTFPLASGEDLVVYCGRETLERFAEMIGSLLIDEEAELRGGEDGGERPGGNDRA